MGPAAAAGCGAPVALPPSARGPRRLQRPRALLPSPLAGDEGAGATRVSTDLGEGEA